MERIHSLTIPEDILNDESLSPFEMFMYAFERQYPNATREQEARAMHIKLHSLYDHKRRKKRKGETAQIRSAQIRSTETRSAQISTPQINSVQTNMSKSTVHKPTPKNIEEFNSDLDFLMNISSKEEYDDAQTDIHKLFTKGYSKSQTIKFDEILSELLQKYGD